MIIAVRALLGLCALLLVVVTLHRARKAQFVEHRVDSLGGPQKGELDEPADFHPLVQRLMAPFGLTIGRHATQAYAIVAAVSLGPLCLLAGWKVAITVGGGIIAGYLVFLRWAKRRRTRQFAERLPVFLERVRRLILIGNTFQQAFIQSASTADPVVKRDIDPIVRRVQHGAPFSDSIDALSRRVDTIELHMLAAYVRTNAKFGGRVAQNLQNLVAQLNNKARLDREIKAATAETRASALVLIAITVFVMAVMAVLNRSYIQFFFDNETGRMILAWICIWPLIGLLVMKRILTLRL